MNPVKTITENKIIAIIGPTASGKSALAVKLAKKFGGEIISADSRQVYRGLDIGSGKITKREMKGVPHHLLDVASPKNPPAGGFSVSDFQKLGNKALGEIVGKNKLPIICGGTGFYVDALIKNFTLPPVPPNPKLRVRLEKLSTEKLAQKLKILDPKRFENIDQNNRPRLIRAIEIATKLGQVPPIVQHRVSHNCLQIGIKLDQEKLKKNIHDRLLKRLRAGLLAEVKKLHASGVSWKRLESFGLEYRFGAKLLQRQTLNFRDASEPASRRVKREKIEDLERDIWHYAKRQMTWWKRDPTIHWIKDYQEVEKLVRKFLKAGPPRLERGTTLLESAVLPLKL